MSNPVENVMIATLGEHPAVITAGITAMEKIAGIPIHRLHVLHPQDTDKYIGREGYQLIERHLRGQCQVFSVPLPFSDANSTETSIQFLRRLVDTLNQYQDDQKYNVYLLIAGGRKSTAAFMALVGQFYSAVHGIYHLLDKNENSRNPAFPSIEQLELEMTAAEIQAALDPPIERLNLISIPYPGAFASPVKLRTALKSFETGKESEGVALSPDAEFFFRDVFQSSNNNSRLEVWLSQKAFDQYKCYSASRNSSDNKFLNYFKHMQKPVELKNGIHGTFNEFHFFKRGHTKERPFFFTEPNPIHLYPERSVKRVIVCALAVEQGNGQYTPTAEEIQADIDKHPKFPLSSLNHRDLTLIIPLGKSPMVATQIYTLLTGSRAEGPSRISTVALIYPEQNSAISNSVRLLKRQFKTKNVEIEDIPLKDLQDLDSHEACKVYLRGLDAAIQKLREKHPEREIALSLSGGRKGMSVLAYFAAQHAGIEKVYHMLITDKDMESRIETETTLQALDRLPTDVAKARRLFLEEYDSTKFELFMVPVIPLKNPI